MANVRDATIRNSNITQDRRKACAVKYLRIANNQVMHIEKFLVAMDSLALEVRFSALRHGFNAFFEICRFELPILFGTFMRNGLLQLFDQTLTHRGTSGLNRQRCRDSDFFRKFHGLLTNLGLWHQQIGQPNVQRFLTIDATACEKKQVGFLNANQTRQRD